MERKVLEKDLLSKIDFNKLSHAYIFEGSDLGRLKDLAKVFIVNSLARESSDLDKSLLEDKLDNKAVSDVFILEPEKSIIPIDKVRELIGFFQTRPYHEAYKIGVISPADAMRVEAQNSMLKLLEELADYGKLILLTNQAKLLLPTIRSRCQMIKFESNNLLSYDENFILMAREIINGNMYFFTKDCEPMKVVKGKEDEFFSFMIDLLKSLIVNNTSFEKTLIEELKTSLNKRSMSYEIILEAIDLCIEIQKRLKNNVNFQMSIERLTLEFI